MIAIPILLFAAAGALIGGGAGGGLALWNKAKRESAKVQLQETDSLYEEALRAKLRLMDLEEEAKSRGINPDEVRTGVQAILDGHVDAGLIFKGLQGPA